MNPDFPPLTVAFLHHQSELRQFLYRRVHCAETAADLLHDTYLQIADYPAQGQIANGRAFLYRVAGNLALDHLRAQTRQQARDGGDLDDEWPCLRPQPEDYLQARQQWLEVSCWLSSLPLSGRQMLYWYRLDGKSQRQIATELGVSERHVEHVLSRAGKLLAEKRLIDDSY
ncbi:RNA polymerase sigma factor [Methylomonas methanica]|uniref:RNA polymerase, sigma-24 subunit, ECF subfamily n=1 Tax=Methylomonas methanica (strain DSM 25384 / MC09) TaxID=857087 RepID=G0A1I6_METMM|nr:sigma-70 family RNA polymerase sigma factor [Methylomonas methanica]AEF98879.1 RNA polymerase, sigma-24 subunit, ECF subfamily [Methylomonas methanica MC09]